MKAKQIVADKFWIVEDSGNQVATIQSTITGDMVYVTNKSRESFPSISMLADKYNISFKDAKRNVIVSKQHQVNNFPCKDEPFNQVIDIRKQIPIYTKTLQSRSFYCAGYYVIEYPYGNVVEFSPKLITLDRNAFRGPFMSKADAV